jgi:glycosyltransferase involved in cell wall biosynthesis
VTLEAMACALPVVAVSATGATNLVRDGDTGMLAEPGDIGSLADAIAAYAASPALRRRHGEAGLAMTPNASAPPALPRSSVRSI